MTRKCLYAVAAILLSGVPKANAENLEPLWVWNVGSSAAEVAAGQAGEAVVSVPAGEGVVLWSSRSAAAKLLSFSRAELLVIQASPDFDSGDIEIDVLREIRREGVVGRPLVRVSRPNWARELLALEAAGTVLGARDAVDTVALPDSDGKLRLAVWLGRNSAVIVETFDRHGMVVSSLSASATVPVRWRADLGSTSELGGERLSLQVKRGTAVVSLPYGDHAKRFQAKLPIIPPAQQGTASFSQTINCSGSTTYQVTGGPANTCGELNTYRNGQWQFTPNWICTDSWGNASKGPWYWSSTPSDQTDEPAFIRWPNGNTTNNANHYWDKTPAETVRDSPWGAPPTSYYGHAEDAQWGLGFDFGGYCSSDFRNLTTDLWWDPAIDSYSSVGYKGVNNTLSRVNRWYVSWSGPFPSPGSHVSGDTYEWWTCCLDGCWGYCTYGQFTP